MTPFQQGLRPEFLDRKVLDSHVDRSQEPGGIRQRTTGIVLFGSHVVLKPSYYLTIPWFSYTNYIFINHTSGWGWVGGEVL